MAQVDCNAANATSENPTGCQHDLFPWVETTVGAGTNGLAQPAGFNDMTTGEGSTSMGFYNMLQGDAPYLKYLADNFAISDNYHQAVMGGTGANHVMLGSGDAIWFADSNGHPTEPPHNQFISAGPNSGTVDEIENPTPRLARTTGTPKMATAAVPTAQLLTVAEPIPTVSIQHNPGLSRSLSFSDRLLDPSIPTANRATIIF